MGQISVSNSKESTASQAAEVCSREEGIEGGSIIAGKQETVTSGSRGSGFTFKA